MIINIDGEENEMVRVNGTRVPQDKVSVMDISPGFVLAELPCGFSPEVHDPMVEEIFASSWKSAWDPNNLILTPESGEWEVGLSISSVVNSYVKYFSETYWCSAIAGSMYYVGNDSDGAAQSLSDVKVYVKFPTDRAINMFTSGELDLSLFKKKYNALLAERGDTMDYTGPIDGSISIDLANEIDPAIWTAALMSSKLLVSKFGEDVDLKALFSDFISKNKSDLEASIYILSPSDKAEADRMRESINA